MARDIAPWRSARGLATRPWTENFFQNPFFGLQQQFERAFDDIFRGVDMPATTMFGGRGMAACDIRETGAEVEVSLELPGFQEKDIDVSLQDGALVIKAEADEEQDDRREDYVYSERRRGSIQRTVHLPDSIDQDRVTASFENGVLTIKVPKLEAKMAARRIPLGSDRPQVRRDSQVRPQLQQAAHQPQGGSRQQQGGS